MPIRSLIFQTLVFLICTILPRCHHVGFSSETVKFRPTLSRIPEYRHFEETISEQVGVVFDRIMGSCDPELIVDQVGNLSTSKETVLFLRLFVPSD